MSKNIFFYLYYLHADYFHRLPCFYHNVLEFLPSFDLRQVIHHWNVGWKKNCPRKNFLISLSLPIPGKKKPYKPSSGCIYYAPIAKSDDPPHELWKVGVVWANARVSSRISHDDFKAFLPLKCQQRNIFIPQFPSDLMLYEWNPKYSLRIWLLMSLDFLKISTSMFHMFSSQLMFRTDRRILCWNSFRWMKSKLYSV